MDNEDLNLRTVRIVIHSLELEMLMIGHVALALGRPASTIKRWERQGLLPQAAFILNPNRLSARRRLYIPAYVDALQVIRQQGYVCRRLDRDHWAAFRRLAFEAFEETVVPLLCRDVGVTDNGPAGPHS